MNELKPVHMKKISNSCFIVLTNNYMKEFVDDIIFEYIIDYIILEGDETRTIKILTNRLEMKMKRIEDRDRHNQACLRAIHKINRGKDECIAALSAEPSRKKGGGTIV